MPLRPCAFLCCVLLVQGCATVASVTSAQSCTARPNLVVISCDDMGWGDIPGLTLRGVTAEAYTAEMPNIARLEREGALFTNFYSAQPVCSASRAALLTGCYPNRIGIHGALFPTDTNGIDAHEVTLAEMLRERGYVSGVFGKWHLGCAAQHNPTLHGFDEFFGIPYSNDMWKERFAGHPPLPLYDGAMPMESIDDLVEAGAITKRITHRACAFIRRAAAENKPFFTYVAHPQPHTPLAVSAAFATSDREKLYAAVMHEIDWSVGEVLRTLEACGAASNTIVMFTSDNGPWLAFGCDAGSTGGLREGKGTTFEGGVRVPCVLRWPDHVPKGAVCDTPWMTIDLFSTMAMIVQAPAPDAARPIDGADARAIWECGADAKPSHEMFLFYYHTNALEAVRMGRWKLCLPHPSRVVDAREGLPDWGEAKYRMEDVPLALFDLEMDPSETNNLVEKHPEVVAEILRGVELARADLGDSLTQRKGAGARNER